MTNEEVEKGIAAYKPMQDELLEYMKDRWVHQDEFDLRFSKGPDVVMGFTYDSFILGSATGGWRDRYLDLAKLLCWLEKIETKDEDGAIWYRTK